MRTNSYIKQLLNKMLFILLIILLSPQVSFCWDLIEFARNNRDGVHIISGIGLMLIGLLVALKILGWAFSQTKPIAKKVTNTSHEISVIVKNKIEEARRNRLYNKIEESVLDEIVREAVRQAIREGVRPDVIKLCTECLGGGCHQCDNKGWTT